MRLHSGPQPGTTRPHGPRLCIGGGQEREHGGWHSAVPRRDGSSGGKFEDYTTAVTEGMVVLDAVHKVQAKQANDLAVRWNCKAGKCGSCSAEINGKPALMCMTQLAHVPLDQPVVIEPMRAFPGVKDLVTDVSWNYEVKKRIKRFQPRPPDAPDGTWRMGQADVNRV